MWVGFLASMSCMAVSWHLADLSSVALFAFCAGCFAGKADR